MVDWLHVALIGLVGGIANMAPIFMKPIKVWDAPVDCGLKLRGKPLLGKNKTWRGLFAGVVFGIFAVYLFQLALGMNMSWFAIVAGGFLIGFGALFGDMFFSLIKRQIGPAPGPGTLQTLY